MCNLYDISPKGDAERFIGAQGWLFELGDYPDARTVGPNQRGVFLRPGNHPKSLRSQLGQWGMIRHGSPPPRPGDKRYASNNARVESIHEKPTFRDAWRRGQRCLIPARWYAEPNWETGRNVWWHLKRQDGSPWFLAGLWDEWVNRETGELIPNFTMITCNCDDHPLLNRLHKPVRDQETGEILPMERQDKRSLIHIAPEHWEQWIHGTQDDALALIKPQPVEVFDQSDAHMTDELLAKLKATETGPLF